jgi:hypothetical protein
MARTTPASGLFVTVRSEGGLLPPDLLARIAANDPEMAGLRPEDYGLPKGERLTEAASRAWANARAHWAAFRATSGMLGERESGTSETREQWIIPLFRELGWGRLAFRAAAEEVEGKRFPISHRGGEGDGPDAPPVHVISFRHELDKPAPAGASGTGPLPGLRVSPHGLVQDYFNRTDHTWGVVTNGRRLRLLRDNVTFSRPAFVEFDLEGMLEGGVYADFVLLFLLLHRSRLAAPGVAPRACWLERWREDAAARGTRALDALRDGVEAAIRALGQGLLEHQANAELRARLLDGRLTGAGYYRQLLRLVYRLLFLLAAEERDLLFPPGTTQARRDIYADHYGVGRLRELVGRRRAADRHDDLWRSLTIAFAMLRDETGDGERIGLPPLGGGLFDADACPDLDGAMVANDRLLAAIRGLAFAKDPKTGLTRRVNYRDMDVEELGSVYEGLLELQPVLRTAGERPEFSLGASGERKSTGSYYTNAGLVRELIASALDPVIAAALERGKTREEQRANLLSLRVCDPACGSGHFLLAAARRLGRELARLMQDESEPDPAAVRAAMREVIARCIYGVDRNPLAVDLCKLALWLEGHDAGQPLSFFDHHIKRGNSLVGATNELLAAGVPDAAFEPVTDDDKQIASALRRRNKEEHRNLALPMVLARSGVAGAHEYAAAMAAPETTVAESRAKEQTYRRHVAERDYRHRQLVAHLWTAAFFWPLHKDAPEAPTHGTWQQLAADLHLPDYADPAKRDEFAGIRAAETARYAQALADTVAFFHWELEYEDVFAGDYPGFDCILGNPPWERVKLQEQEFFASRDPEIAKAPNAAARGRAIAALRETNPVLHAAFEGAKSASENESGFLRKSGRFPLTGRGDVNTYSVFAEQMARGLRTTGRAGIIVPTGIATDDTNKAFFGWLVNSGRLAALYDFENREGIFPGVHRSYKFAALTVAGADRPAAPFEVAFFLVQPDQVRAEGQRFTLSAADIALFNPNTRTCPIFRSARDAAITKRLYEAAPVLIREGDPDGNPWGVKFLRMLDMSNDSGLFRTWDELTGQGFAPSAGGRFGKDGATYLPLYEAKLIHQFDHRFATYERAAKGEATRDLTEAEHADPACPALPRYWVDEREVERAAGAARREHRGWFIGFRDITNATNERTAIFSLVPWAGVGNKVPLLAFGDKSASQVAAFLANVNSLAQDFAARQKIGGMTLNFFIVKQFPVLPPSAYTPALLDLIVPRVLELVYTAHDLAPFARDCGYDGPPFVWDEERRAQLRADLDGIYAHLYGLDRDDFAYILDTFPIVRQKDERRWGEYRTKRLCLDAYDRFGPLVAPARVTEEPTTNKVISIPVLGTIAASAPAAQPRPEPVPVAAAPTAVDVPLAAPALPGLASPKATGPDRFWQAAVLSWVAARGKGDFHFGRLKLVKELYFVQEHLGVDLRLDFVREAAGPLDPAVYKVEGLAVKKGWLQIYGKRDERATYAAGRQAGEAANLTRQRLRRDLARVEELLAFFRPFDSGRIEQWATIHQVWRDRRARGAPSTFDALVADVRAWKPDKRGFDEATIGREVAAMAREGMIALDS